MRNVWSAIWLPIAVSAAVPIAAPVYGQSRTVSVGAIRVGGADIAVFATSDGKQLPVSVLVDRAGQSLLEGLSPAEAETFARAADSVLALAPVVGAHEFVEYTVPGRPYLVRSVTRGAEVLLLEFASTYDVVRVTVSRAEIRRLAQLLARGAAEGRRLQPDYEP